MSVTLHTSHGDLKIHLNWQQTPLAAKNFLALAASGYYDNTVFHRNIPGFMIQGGDPSGSGTGGESIFGKPFADECTPELRHSQRGIVSMANSGPNTNGSQFFITYAKQSHLNGKNTVLGRVVEGWKTLDNMEELHAESGPKHQPVLYRVTIHANPIADLEA